MDLELLETGNGGDIVKGFRDLSVINGFQNMVYLALFGGNPGHVTPVNRPENSQDFSWWGNSLLFGQDQEFQFNSLTEYTLMTTALNSSGASTIQQAIFKDLEFMKKFSDIDVSVSILSDTQVEITVLVDEPDNQQDKAFVFVWDSTKSELPSSVKDEVSEVDTTLLPPSGLNLVSSSSNSLTISAVSNSVGLETSFEWQLSEDPSFSTFISENTPSGDPFPEVTFIGLLESTNYNCRVRALGDDPSDWSEILAVSTVYDFGLAIRSDGINDRLLLSTALDGVSLDADNWSVSFRINFNSEPLPAYSPYIFQLGEGSNIDRSIDLRYTESGGVITLNLSSSGAIFGGIVLSVDVPFDSDWHHLVVTRETNPIQPTTNLWNLYFDAVPLAINQTNDKVRTPTTYSNQEYFLGNRTSNRWAALSLDNVEIFHSYLTSSDVSNINMNPSFSDTLNPLLQLNFNKSGAIGGGDNTSLDNTCVDTSGNGYDAQLQNFAKIGVVSNWIDHN